jgi:hypothetical protein
MKTEIGVRHKASAAFLVDAIHRRMGQRQLSPVWSVPFDRKNAVNPPAEEYKISDMRNN